MEKYVCKECGAEVKVEGEKITRTCDHTGTIILEMETVLTGDSTCSQ